MAGYLVEAEIGKFVKVKTFCREREKNIWILQTFQSATVFFSKLES